jgi:hypothetical protein
VCSTLIAENIACNIEVQVALSVDCIAIIIGGGVNSFAILF